MEKSGIIRHRVTRETFDDDEPAIKLTIAESPFHKTSQRIILIGEKHVRTPGLCKMLRGSKFYDGFQLAKRRSQF